jgi:2-dehydro-3-deoxygalactonokinase
VRAPGGVLPIVPGIACRDNEGVPDVMRGEETQLVGAVAGESPPAIAVLPGTHSKWAIVRGGAIEAFATYMTGEVYAVLREHSILGRMANGSAFAPAAFARGVRAGLAQRGSADALLHRLFGARTLALRADLAPEETGEYLSGLLIGSEIAAGREWTRERGLAAESILLVGSRALCERYSQACNLASIAAVTGPADAAARGLWRIAKAAAIVP